jgi:hypothetical protein
MRSDWKKSGVSGLSDASNKTAGSIQRENHTPMFLSSQNTSKQNRQDYLLNLARDNGIDVSVVSQLTEMLGPDEDFDGLVANLDDFYFSFLGVE